MAKAWFKFFPANFVEATYSWSPAEVGVYFRLLLFQFSNGRLPAAHVELQRIAGCDAAEFETIWERINHKFEACEDGFLFNEKMNETANEAEQSYNRRAKAAKLSHKNRGDVHCTSNAPCNAPASASGSGSGSGSSSLVKKKRNDYDSDFELFWKAYPAGRKTNKASAAKAFQKATKIVEPAVIISAATEYAQSPTGQGDFVKMPATWLNGGCWDDDRAAWGRGDSSQPKSKQQQQLERLAAKGVFGGQQSPNSALLPAAGKLTPQTGKRPNSASVGLERHAGDFALQIAGRVAQ